MTIVNALNKNLSCVLWLPHVRQGALSFFQSERNDLQGTGVRMSSGGRHKSGHGDLLETISIGFIAGGLIFKGLISPFRLV